MLFAKAVASAFLVGSSLALPLLPDSNVERGANVAARGEYWLPPAGVSGDIAARGEYWLPPDEVTSRSKTTRAVLEPHCRQATEGIYCTYTNADVEAYGVGTQLRGGCSKVDSGVECFYAGATPADDVGCSSPAKTLS